MEILCTGHPLLELAAFTCEFARPLGQIPSPDWLVSLLVTDHPAPLRRSEAVRGNTRDLLRVGGYKPTGRSKPASEYLARAAEQGPLPTINLAVDANNVVSLHSGLPISVFDLDRVNGPVRVAIAEDGMRYSFNRSGQEIDVSGLLCALDDEGPCGNAVKDAQRTKTSDATTRTVSLVWGSRSHTEQVEAAVSWYRELLARAGAITTACTVATS